MLTSTRQRDGIEHRIVLQFVEAGPLGRRFESAGLTDHGFPRSQHQKSVAGQRIGKAMERQFAGLSLKIKQDIAAQYEVKSLPGRGFGQYIVLLKPGDGAHVVANLPTIGRLIKMAEHLRNAQSALNLKLAVQTCPRGAHNRVRHIRAQNVDCPTAPFFLLVFEQHGEGVNLLSGGTSGAPDRNPFCVLTSAGDFRKKFVRNLIKGRLVTKEIGFVVQQRFDHFRSQVMIRGSTSRYIEQTNKLIDIADIVFAKHSGESGGNAPAAAFGQMLSGPLGQKVGDDLIRGLADFHTGQRAAPCVSGCWATAPVKEN